MPPKSQNLRIEPDDAVAVVTFDRPDVRNALTDEVLSELVEVLSGFDRDPGIRCIVLAGSEKVFVSGADINALRKKSALDIYTGERARNWAALRSLSTPMIAAISGHCLGGGLELAMYADISIASETAKFGLPETQLGLIPGAGGTQLLTHTAGKAVAMDVILSGRILDATEAADHGIISRVTAADAWLDTSVELAHKVAARPATAQRLAKESVDNALESSLAAGIETERKAFAIAFESEDSREGLAAFIEKRDPEWRHR